MASYLLTTTGTVFLSIIYICCAGCLVYASFQFFFIAQTTMQLSPEQPSEDGFHDSGKGRRDIETTPLFGSTASTRVGVGRKLVEIHEAIVTGSKAFLSEEYAVCIVFTTCFAFILLVLISWAQDSIASGALTSGAFVLGSITSILAGYIGMRISVFSNARTAINAEKEGYYMAFMTAFRSGSILGFCLSGLGILVLFSTLLLFSLYYRESPADGKPNFVAPILRLVLLCLDFYFAMLQILPFYFFPSI